jgi:hypothetical protein
MEYSIKVSAEVWEQLQVLAERHVSSVDEVAGVILAENIDRYLADDGEEPFTEQQLAELRAVSDNEDDDVTMEDMQKWLEEKLAASRANREKEKVSA